MKKTPAQIIRELKAEIRRAQPVTNPAILKKAAALGAASFSAGKARIPAMDHEAMSLLGENGGHANDILEAWLSGWDRSNLDAPVPEDTITPAELAAVNLQPLPWAIKYNARATRQAWTDGAWQIIDANGCLVLTLQAGGESGKAMGRMICELANTGAGNPIAF